MEARELDLAIARAWPARTRVAVGPWTARLDAGVTRRANSVLPHGSGAAPDAATLDAWLRTATALYGRRGLIPWIQLSQAAWPPTLERELEARGWATGIDRTLLLGGPLPGDDSRHEVRLASRPTADWIATWWALDARGGALERAAAAAILARVDEPAAFASVACEGVPAGVALGVLVDRTLVLECVATRPAGRRRGIACSALGALGRWARERGAESALLAVQEVNAPGRRLYERLGLTPVGDYTYARPSQAASAASHDV